MLSPVCWVPAAPGAGARSAPAAPGSPPAAPPAGPCPPQPPPGWFAAPHAPGPGCPAAAAGRSAWPAGTARGGEPAGAAAALCCPGASAGATGKRHRGDEGLWLQLSSSGEQQPYLSVPQHALHLGLLLLQLGGDRAQLLAQALLLVGEQPHLLLQLQHPAPGHHRGPQVLQQALFGHLWGGNSTMEPSWAGGGAAPSPGGAFRGPTASAGAGEVW